MGRDTKGRFLMREFLVRKRGFFRVFFWGGTECRVIPANRCNDKGGISPPPIRREFKLPLQHNTVPQKALLWVGNRDTCLYTFQSTQIVYIHVMWEIERSRVIFFQSEALSYRSFVQNWEMLITEMPAMPRIKEEGEGFLLVCPTSLPIAKFFGAKKGKSLLEIPHFLTKAAQKKKICSDPSWPQPLGY